MMKMSRSIIGWVVVLAVMSFVVAGVAIAASDSEAPAATDTDTPSLVGGTLTGGAGGAGGAAGGAGGGATGGGGADVRVAQY